MKTMKQFVKENRVRIQCEWSDENKNNPDWKDANHYKVTLKMGRKQLTTYFSMGYAQEPPGGSGGSSAPRFYFA